VAKLDVDTAFFDFLNSFDIFFLLETWVVDSFDVNIFESKFVDCKLFWIFAQKGNNVKGRALGGCLIGVKIRLLSNWTFVPSSDVPHLKHKNGTFLIPAYFSCHSCKVWSSNLQVFSDFLTQIDSEKVVLLGDFNARVGNKDISIHDSGRVSGRVSKDRVVSNKGISLINFCNDFNLIILNGRGLGDEEGQLTFFNAQGQSVIDYALVSEGLYDQVQSFKIGCRLESDHFPILLELRGLGVQQSSSPDFLLPLVPRLSWKLQDQDLFKVQLQEIIAQKNFANLSLQEAVTDLNAAIKEVAVSRKPVHFYTQPWFDKVCLVARKKFHKALLKFQRVSSTDNHELVFIAKRFYKKICSEKKLAYQQDLVNGFEGVADPIAFWGAVKKLKTGNNVTSESIKGSDWYSYFKNLLNPQIQLNSFSTANNLVLDWQQDSPFLLVELKSAVSKIKNNKAPGVDTIPGEFYKFLLDETYEVILGIFNRLFVGEGFPDAFTESVVFPLFKKGDIN